MAQSHLNFDSRRRNSSLLFFGLLVTLSVAVFVSPTDSLGYTVTSGGPSLFTDISATGTVILDDVDDETAAAPIGFTFPFYGSAQTSVYISSNGLVTFGSANSGYNNTNLTTTSVGQPALAVMWDDFVTRRGSTDKVYYQTTGSLGSRVFTVQWHVNAIGETDEMIFQCQLFEATADIAFNYQDVNSNALSHGLGASATVGIQDTAGNASGRFVQWSHETASLSSGLSLVFSEPAAPDIVVQHTSGDNINDGGSVSFGTVAAGSTVSLDFIIKNWGNDNLTGLGITIDGQDAALFSVTAFPVSPVSGPNGSTSFTVAFSPADAAAKTAFLHIASNDSDESPFDITLTAGPKVLPDVTSVGALSITHDGALLLGAVNAKGSQRTITFEYGETASYGYVVTASPSSLGTNTATYVTGRITGLLGHTRYHFRAVAAGPQGSNAGKDATFVTANQAPSLIDLSLECLPNAETTLDLLQYALDPDGDDISIASFTQPTSGGNIAKRGNYLVFTSNSQFSAAKFTYSVRDSLGAVSTASVNLSVGTGDVSPKDEFRPSAANTYPIQITTTSLWDAIESIPWATISPATGDGNGTVTVALQPNSSTKMRTGIIKVGGVIHTVTQGGVLPPSISMPPSIPPAIVSGAYSLTIPTENAPVTYRVTNMPPGLYINHATGVISGVPTKGGSYAMTVKASNAAGVASQTLAFTINVQALPVGTVGTFHGLVERHDDINSGLGSRIELSTSITGSLTGRMVTGTIVKSFVSQLVATTSDPNHPRCLIPISGTDLTLNLAFDHSGNLFSGTLGVQASSTSVNGWRNGWLSPGVGVPVGGAAGYRALHGFVLDQTDANIALPQGFGYASINVTTSSCLAAIAGKLADGSVITCSTFVGQAGEVLVYQSLYRNQGSCIGKLVLTQGAAAPADNTLVGQLTWMKPAPLSGSTDTVYKAGFGPIPLNAIGSTYVPPAKGQRVMGVPNAPDNAKLGFTLGGLDAEAKEFDQLLRINNPSTTGLTNSAAIPAFNSVLSPNPNPNKVTMPVLNASTGQFSGEFTLAGTTASLNRKVAYSGQIVKTATGTQGYGYFLLPKVPGTGETVATSPKLSGRVVLEAP